MDGPEATSRLSLIGYVRGFEYHIDGASSPTRTRCIGIHGSQSRGREERQGTEDSTVEESALNRKWPPLLRAYLVAQSMQSKRSWSPRGHEDPLEKEMATHSSILAWRIPWTVEPGKLQSTGLQKSQAWLSNWTPPPPLLYGDTFEEVTSITLDT